MGIADGFLYETLTPLSTSNNSNSPPPLSSSSSEPYVVFRNEISLDSIIPSATPNTSTTDYFSLDVADDDNAEAAPVFEIFTPLQSREPERTLEGNWFRADSRFKSPMLQLHKGSFLNYSIIFVISHRCNGYFV